MNGLTGALTLAGGNGISITPSGSTLTIAATGGGGGGLTLPYIGEWDTGNAFQVLNSGASGAAISGSSTGGASGLNGFSASGYGIRGSSNTGIGVYGASAAGNSNTAVGVYGINNNTSGAGAGVGGANSKTGNLGFLGGPTYGVAGVSANGSQTGVFGTSSSATGYGVEATNTSSGYGVFATSTSGSGVYGSGNHGVDGSGTAYGLYGTSFAGDGVYGSGGLNGVYGLGSVNGVYGETNGTSLQDDSGVRGNAPSGNGLYGTGVIGVFAQGSLYAGSFAGDIQINGHVHTSGVGDVRLDDPADPANSTITHAFVGSSEMKNIYDGVAILGPSGTATVALPAWFETLNKDFRYQLTALGTPQAGLFVSKEIANSEFTIAGGVPGARVSWQVTGVRRDPWANAHPIQARQAKSDSDRGFYIVPELYGQPKTKSADPIQRKEALEAEREGHSNER